MSPAPLMARMPAIYQGESFVERFVAAFDDALAPVLLTLDGLHHYIDPTLAPSDFLAWVAQWLGIEVDDAWPVEQQREIVMGAVRLHSRRGTPGGVADAVRLTLGLGPTGTGPRAGTVEVSDSGGTRWSATPGTPMPGTAKPGLTVHVTVADPNTIDRRRLERVVAEVKPAHIPHTVVVTAGHSVPQGTSAPVPPPTEPDDAPRKPPTNPPARPPRPADGPPVPGTDSPAQASRPPTPSPDSPERTGRPPIPPIGPSRPADRPPPPATGPDRPVPEPPAPADSTEGTEPPH